jgi:hypothetical protein
MARSHVPVILASGLALWLALANSAQAASGAHASGPVARQQLQGLANGQAPCSAQHIAEAVKLIYVHGDLDGAARLVVQCDAEGRAQAQVIKRLIGLRIRALIAMSVKDLDTLHAVGQTLAAQQQVPEYAADGHMCVAFACLATGDTRCAREHMDSARRMFTQLKIETALDQLAPLEQALVSLEQMDDSP